MATIKNINVSQPNDGLGDTLRVSQIKANDNFSELNEKKVEKIAGKDLSENDFTDVLKAKLDGIEENATAQVQSDVFELDENSPAYIKNFPIDRFLQAFGHIDYANSGIAQNAVSGVELKLTNDKLGIGTDFSNAPFGVSSLFDSTTNQFDFSQLNVGDGVDFTPNMNIDFTNTNASFSLYLKIAIGTADERIVNLINGERKSTNDFNESLTAGFYIKNQNEIDFPAELYILTDANATVKVNGFLFKIIRKNINIVDISKKLQRVVSVTLSEIGITAPTYTKEEIETAVTAYRQTLPFDAVYDILVIENVPTSELFDVTADWVGNGVTDENSFIAFLNGNLVNPVRNNLTNIVISDFSLTEIFGLQRLTCLLRATGTALVFYYPTGTGIGVKEVAGLGNIIGIEFFGFAFNSLGIFNPIGGLPTTLTYLGLQENNLTSANYSDLETWANLQTPFTNPCTIGFENNTHSVIGTNLETILLTKNCIVNG